MSDPIRDALERAARELERAGDELMMADCLNLGKRAKNEAHAVRAALATPTPSLAELVNPQPGYQPGTGNEDGAQLVQAANGPEWWAPEFGCDSLDATLDAICSRIAPYLREPVAGVDVPGPDGDYGDVLDLCAAEGVDPRVGVPLLQRARKAWDVGVTTTPPADGEVGPSEEEWDALVERVWDAHRAIGYRGDRLMWDGDFERAAAMLRNELARWGRPTTPTPPEIRPEVRAAFTELERRQENLRNFRQLRADLATATSTPLADPDALAARPLLEAVARMGDCIGQHTVGQVMALSDRATSWLNENPPGQPMAIEPRGCPTPPADGEAEELAGNLESVAIHLLDICCNDYADYVNAAADYVDRAAALLRQLPPEGLVTEVCWHPASGARIIRDVVVHSGEPGECWTVRNHRHVNPCTEFPTLAAAWEALQQARRQEGSDD